MSTCHIKASRTVSYRYQGIAHPRLSRWPLSSTPPLRVETLDRNVATGSTLATVASNGQASYPHAFLDHQLRDQYPRRHVLKVMPLDASSEISAGTVCYGLLRGCTDLAPNHSQPFERQNHACAATSPQLLEFLDGRCLLGTSPLCRVGSVLVARSRKALLADEYPRHRTGELEDVAPPRTKLRHLQRETRIAGIGLTPDGLLEALGLYCFQSPADSVVSVQPQVSCTS